MAIGTHSYAVFRSVIALSSFWCYQRNACEILMQSRLLVLEVAYFCYPKCVPSFWRKVGNPRKWVIVFISPHNYSFKLVHSLTCSLVLILHRQAVIRMQAHHTIVLILSSLVATQMWTSNTLFVLFWHLPLSLCWVVSHVRKMFCQLLNGGKPSDA